MKTILVPTDFSTPSHNALEYALSLAEKLQAEVHIAHFYHFENMSTASMPPEVKRQMQILERKDANRKLSALTNKIKAKAPEGVTIHKHLEMGFATHGTCELAGDLNADLIVMGTQGASNLSTRLLGTVASFVIKEASCPVLVIPAEATYKPIEHIVYAGNFEDGETDIFERLENFSQALNTRLACVHIRTKHEDDETFEIYDRYFREKAKAHEANYYPINYNRVVDGLDNFMEIVQADVLAILTHKRSLIEGIFHPSITKKMVLHTKTPILVFRKDTISHLVSQQQAQ